MGFSVPTGGAAGFGQSLGQGITSALNALIMPQLQQNIKLRNIERSLPQIEALATRLGTLSPLAQQLATGIKPQQVDPLQQMLAGFLMNQFGGAQQIGQVPVSADPIPSTGTVRRTPTPQATQRINVRDKVTGQTGTIEANEFNADRYERI